MILERTHQILDKKNFQFEVHNLLVMWPLDDATVCGLLRTFGRNRITIQRLTSVSCELCRGAKRHIAPVVNNFNISFWGSAISECHSVLCKMSLELTKHAVNM